MQHRIETDGEDPPTARGLTLGEMAFAGLIFGDAIDYSAVRIHRRPWWWLQPREVVMAPDGHIWCHPRGSAWRPDYSREGPALQGLFIHEMTHVWQAQKGGRWFLPLARHPFCRYRYDIVAGRPFHRYGLEQQAEIVRHAWLARLGGGQASRELDALLPFRR